MVSQTISQFMELLSRLAPRILTTISIIVVGWIIAAILRYAVRMILGWIRVNVAAERSGISRLLSVADLPQPDAFIASIVFWLVWIGFFLSAVDVLGLRSAQSFFAAFIAFLPRLFVAVVILLVGFIAARFLSTAALLAAIRARVPSPRLLSGLVRWFVLLLAGAMALEQAALAHTIVLTAFAFAFGALMLGAAIAFGVGGSGIARRILEHQFSKQSQSRADEVSEP